MIIADWVIIALIVFLCIIGFIVGFGRGLDIFTRGFFGFIISIIVCYCLGGIIYEIAFVQELLEKLNNALLAKNTGFCNFLVKIHFDIIVYYVTLFIIVTIIRVIIVKIVKSIVEVDNVILRFINRMFGMVLFVCVLAVFVLITFQIISLIGGSTAEDFVLKLQGSKFKLVQIFENNPLMTIIKVIKIRIQIPA